MSDEKLTKEQLLSELNLLRQRVNQLELADSVHQAEFKKSGIWIENSPVCTKILDLDFNLQYMSSSGVNELEIDDINEYYGHPYPFHFYPDSFKILMRENLKATKSSGKTITQVASVVDIEGNELWYQSTIVPVQDSAGNLDYIMVVSLDITAQKHVEELLRESEEKFKTSAEFFKGVTENTSDIILIVDKMGIVKYANPSVERFLGYQPEELIGTSTFKYIHLADVPRALLDFGKAILTKEIAVPNSFRVLHKDGSEHVLEGTGKNQLKNPAIAGFIMNVHDITERKQAEENLKLSHSLLSATLESTGVPPLYQLKMRSNCRYRCLFT